jgi:hypothetical protein
MPGVPLIAAGNPEAAGGVEGDGASAPGDDARATEEATRPESDNVRVDRAAEPSDEAERTEAAVETAVPTLTSAGASAAPETPPPHQTRSSPLPPAPKKTLEVTPRRWRMSQSSKLRYSPPALLGARAPRNPRPPSQPRPRSSPPKPRSEGHQA